MRVVLDTNILLSSLKRTARNRPIFDAIIAGEAKLNVTTAILLEYLEIIGTKIRPHVAQNVITLINDHPSTKRVHVSFRFQLIKTDPDDNKFVDCAIASNAECIVSNDAHFRILKSIEFPKVVLLTSEEFLEILDKMQYDG